MAWSRMQLSLLLICFYLGSCSGETVFDDCEQQPHALIIDNSEPSFIQLRRVLNDVVKTLKNGTDFYVITLNGRETEWFGFKKNEADENWIDEIVKSSKSYGVIKYCKIGKAFSDIFDKQRMSGTGITTLLVSDKTEIDDVEKVKMAMKNQKLQVVLYGRNTRRWTELTGNSGCVQILGDNVEDVKNAVKSMTESCTDHFNPTQKTVPTDFVSYSTFIIFTVLQFVLHFVLLVVAACCVIYVCKDIKEKRYSTGSKEENERLLKKYQNDSDRKLKTFKTIYDDLCKKVETLVGKTENQKIKIASLEKSMDSNNSKLLEEREKMRLEAEERRRLEQDLTAKIQIHENNVSKLKEEQEELRRKYEKYKEDMQEQISVYQVTIERLKDQAERERQTELDNLTAKLKKENDMIRKRHLEELERKSKEPDVHIQTARMELESAVKISNQKKYTDISPRGFHRSKF